MSPSFPIQISAVFPLTLCLRQSKAYFPGVHPAKIYPFESTNPGAPMALMFKTSRTEKSWILYDWANSAYSIVITTAIFPLFYKSIATESIYLASWAFANSLASAGVAVMAPVLGTVADYPGLKKRMFAFFFFVGVAATLALSLVGGGQWLPAISIYVVSVVGFAGANLFYDAFLVDVTTEDRMDRISSAGFGWGYIGSTIPFVIGLGLILQHERLGIPSAAAATRISFVVTGLWWLGFGIPMLKNVRQNYSVAPSPTPVRDSFRRIGETVKDIRSHRNIFVFLAAYFFYIEGVNTVIRMATPIALSVGIEQNTLLVVLLAIQIVAFPCALLYGRLAAVWTGRRMIFLGIGVYVIVVGLAVALPSVPDPRHRTALFWLLAMLVASSQGGIQALSRSYLGKIVPKNKSSEFFGFYNIVGKFSAIIGPFFVGLFTLLTGQERYGMLSVLVLFLAGGLILRRTTPEARIEG
jgi:UMF1 family MFS transporter